jgi:hypothetical protein
MPTPWPELPYDDWASTRQTLHLWSQVVGKIALALAPLEPQWGNAALDVTPRGIATRPLPCDLHADEAGDGDDHGAPSARLVVELDLRDHQLMVTSSGRGQAAFDLVDGLSVADFYASALDAVAAVGPRLTLNPRAQEMPDPPMLDRHTEPGSYDRDAVTRFHDVLVLVTNAFTEWRASFRGRTTPVNFWWGTFDLAVARFSGRPATPPDGADLIFRRAMDAEEVAVGFWPGDARYPTAAFYGYGYPKPPGIESATIAPAGGAWNEALGELVLDYDVVRTAADPVATLLEFLDSTYEVAGRGLGWDLEALRYE